ncbi:nucleotide exchange factor GrpE [Thermaurantiacus sp.]
MSNTTQAKSHEPAETPAAETPPPGPADPALEAAQSEIARLLAECDQLRDQALRAAAEAENTRRRLEREKADAVLYAATAFARDMLSVADNLERALKALPGTIDEGLRPLVTGLEATHRELLTLFERHGITRVEAVGRPLDPMNHQAMVEVEHDGPEGHVVAELQSGWRMKDRLLRPALVSVARARREEAEETPCSS